mgnify:FL=1
MCPAPNEDKFAYNSEDAEIQGLSVTVGRMFAKAWHDVKQGHVNMSYALNLLEAYKNLRRALPLAESRWDDTLMSRHIGSTAAWKATQGMA